MKPVQILLAEDHNLVRAGLRSLLDSIDNVEVIAEAKDGREALNLTQLLEPDLILMDIAMPGLNGLEAAAQISQNYPKTQVIILSMHANEEYVLRALRVGVAGYLLKDADVDELTLAITTVIRGEIYLSQAISKQVVADYAQRVGGAIGPLEKLTTRQREILQLVAEGKTTKEIARILRISIKTVETHRADLMTRLDIHDIAGLVRYAVRTGIISVE